MGWNAGIELGALNHLQRAPIDVDSVRSSPAQPQLAESPTEPDRSSNPMTNDRTGRPLEMCTCCVCELATHLSVSLRLRLSLCRLCHLCLRPLRFRAMQIWRDSRNCPNNCRAHAKQVLRYCSFGVIYCYIILLLLGPRGLLGCTPGPDP